MSRAPRRRDVVLYGRRAGVIEREGPSLTFVYEPDYLAGPDPTPLSLLMPPGSQRYPKRLVEAHLRGFLPYNIG
jgi:HipA-like protein